MFNCFSPQLILVLSQLQTSIINILALDGTIACAPPFSSQARGSSKKKRLSASAADLWKDFVLKDKGFISFLFLSLFLLPAVLSQQMMIMEMFIISLVNRCLYRRTYDTLPSEARDNEQNTKVLVEHDVWNQKWR